MSIDFFNGVCPLKSGAVIFLIFLLPSVFFFLQLQLLPQTSTHHLYSSQYYAHIGANTPKIYFSDVVLEAHGHKHTHLGTIGHQS